MSHLISLATTDEPIFLYPYQLGLVLSVAVLQPDAIHERVRHSYWSIHPTKRNILCVRRRQLRCTTLIKRSKKSGSYPENLGRFKKVFTLEMECELVMHNVEMQQRLYGVSLSD